MNDEQMETLLRRHRPAGPPASLRNRCLEAATYHDGATSPASRWAALAAAALVAFALGTYRASGTLQPESLAQVPEVAEISALAASMGGRPEDVALATELVWRRSRARMDDGRADGADGVDR